MKFSSTALFTLSRSCYQYNGDTDRGGGGHNVPSNSFVTAPQFFCCSDNSSLLKPRGVSPALLGLALSNTVQLPQ